MLLNPLIGRYIASLACHRHVRQTRDVKLLDPFTIQVISRKFKGEQVREELIGLCRLLSDSSESSRSSVETLHSVLLDDSPELAGIGGTCGLTLIQHSRGT